MIWTKLPLKPLKLAFSISFASIGFIPIQAQSRLPLILVQHPTLNVKGNSNSNESSPDQGTAGRTKPAGSYEREDLNFEQPPPDQGTPRGTKPGGSRGCPLAVQKSLTALVPVTKEADSVELRWGLTTKEHPTFWFYVPYELKSIHSAKFSLRNQAKQTVYETPVTLTGTPGVISVSLPPTAPPLEINKWYQSYLFIDISCAPNAPLEKDSAQGWVKREALTPALKSELDQATTPLQRAIAYAKYGIWYEALTALADLRRTDSKDDDWTKLLQSVGLDVIASEPIVNCCQPEN